MKLGAACLLCLLLACLTLPVAHGRIRERSMEIRSKENRNPDIDPSWYTGRGIRPVGRFGRRRALGSIFKGACCLPAKLSLAKPCPWRRCQGTHRNPVAALPCGWDDWGCSLPVATLVLLQLSWKGQ
ncbi:prolactin-releasing peptide [Grus japonensis]|uniref:Prolactin-releasing peptide n=1 Tax=Grus japonensis TaxID=30415 RepID=A0ABC9X522_GRUJA